MALEFPTSPTNDQVYENYIYDASRGIWKLNTTAQVLDDLSNVNVSSPENGEVLEYNSSTSQWVTGTRPISNNAIINGDFGIWQRGTAVSGASTYGNYRADRWLVGAVDDGVAWRNMTVSRSTSAPANFEYSAKFTVLDATANRLDISQPFESGEYFANRPVTVSFYIRRIATFNSNIAVSILGSVILSDINTLSTTEFTRLSYTGSFSASTLENSGLSGGGHPLIRISDLSGNEIVASAGDLVEITGVQVELGSVATPFRLAGGGSKAAELALCQRYYYQAVSGGSQAVGSAGAYNAGLVMTNVHFPVTMRVAPSLVSTSGTGYWRAVGNNGGDPFDGFSGINQATTTTAALDATAGVSVIQGYAYRVISIDSNARLAFDSEL